MAMGLLLGSVSVALMVWEELGVPPMSRRELVGLILGTVIVFLVGCGSQDEDVDATVSQEETAIAAIEAAGGRIEYDLYRVPQQLNLNTTQFTDAEMMHLTELTNLQVLKLMGTQVSDSGIVHLKGLTNLQHLELDGIKVSHEGVNKLQKALPRCRIIH